MNQGKKASLTIFLPCLNDGKSIGKLVSNAFLVAKRLTSNFEVIVIDDRSEDNSREVLKRLSKRFRHLKVILHQTNLGYGGALISGFKAATKDLVFYTDGDGQYNIAELPILYSLMTDDVDFVQGIKMARHDPTYRVTLGNLYSFITRWLFWLPIYDIDCDFRLIRNKIVRQLNLTSTSGCICIELVKKSQRSGANFRQVSVHHFERRFGNSQFFKADRILQTFWELILLWSKLMILRKQ